jgi:hypothetical protein
MEHVSEFSPLNTLELRAIEDRLNAGELENAQHSLAQLGHQSDLQHGISYLATRLLFLRGRLDAPSVVERMRELVGANPHFLEARALMEHCQALLQSKDNSTSVTPRPQSLLPSAPLPLEASPTSVDPLQRLKSELQPLEGLALGDDEPPSSWPVPGFENTEYFASDRPTFVPRSAATEPFEDPAGLAPTEYPAGLSGPASMVPSFTRAAPAREIRVDTRPSVIPTSPSLPPPLRYGAPVARPPGRYSSNELEGDDTYESTPPAAEPFSGGRYRMANLPLDVVQPAPNGRALAASVTPRQSPEHRTSVRATDDVHLDLDDGEQPTPFRVPRPALSQPPSSRDVPASYGWSDPERSFGRGDPSIARNRLEQKALEALASIDDSFQAFEQKAAFAASVLSTAPVVHYFAPFDRSLCSLPRLELALRTLYLGVNHLPSSSVRPLVALYLGECLRVSHRGTWRGVPERPTTWAVEAGAHIWQPYRCAGQLLSGTPGQSLLAAAGGGLAKRGTIAWMASAPINVALTKPWPEPFTPQNLQQLGEMVTHTPWSICCESFFGQGLDGSVASLRALDQLLDFLCDSAEAPRPLDPWLVRTATLAGTYVGKVLIANTQAQWVTRSVQAEQGASLELPGGIIATPVANVITRATSRKRSQLHDYVRALLRRSG